MWEMLFHVAAEDETVIHVDSYKLCVVKEQVVHVVWKVAAAFTDPDGMTSRWKLPVGVLKVVYVMLSWAILIW